MSYWKQVPIWEAPEPWSLEQITESTFRARQKTIDEIDRLSGKVYVEAMEQLHMSLSIFVDSVEDLFLSINAFKAKLDVSQFSQSPRKEERDLLITKIQRGIFCSAVSAMALVDHTRNVTQKVSIAGFQEQVNDRFNNNKLHKFVHSLRRFVTHVGVTKSSWVVTHDKQGKSVFFILGSEELLEWGDWSSLAREFIISHQDGINVESMFNEYLKAVSDFHNWLRTQIYNSYHKEIERYLHYKRQYDAVGYKVSWDILLNQFAPKGLDPFMYLEKRLTREQLNYVFSLPYKSKTQVDEIIRIVDTDKICDDALRKRAYEIFEVGS